MSVTYQTVVIWDRTLADLEFTDTDTIGSAFAGLVQTAVKITTGAPTATPNKFIAGALIQNAVDGTLYQNTGTSALPVWTLQGTGGGGITQLTGDVTAGPGSGSQVSSIATDVIANAHINTAAAISFSKLEALPAAEILVGSAGSVPTAVAMSGDASIDNAGVVTVTGATGDFQAGGAVYGFGAGLDAGFIPNGSAPQALSGPGAINITSFQTQFTSTGTGDALSLIDATQIGHLKKISYIAEAGGADTGILTPTNGQGFTTATFNAIGDYLVLMWNGSAWLPIEYIGVTLA